MEKVKVLFLCTGNSCRSQMAEGWVRYHYSDVMEPHSAGTVANGLDPRAVRAMAERGVDISGQRSKTMEELGNIHPDWVVTLCQAAAESCPVFNGPVRRIHAGFDDPPGLARDAPTEEEAMRHYRRVRDEILRFIETLPEKILFKNGIDRI